jgi:hypothetical protein
MPTEINAEEELRRLKEDALARNHCGYFKLWKCELEDEPKGYSYNRKPRRWLRKKLLGIYPNREPCEQFLEVIEWGPQADYEFVLFSDGHDHINGYWEVEIDKTGELAKGRRGTTEGSEEWKWDWWRDRDRKTWTEFEEASDWNNGERFYGRARTRERALEVAREYKTFYEEWVAAERPKRAEGCYCGPKSSKPCGKCEDAEKVRKKQDCGCPHCEGDHDVTGGV